MIKCISKLVTRPAYDNTVDVYDPEVWARESLAILRENMVMAGLVHRNFENQIQEAGDIVNTRLPGQFTAKRKGDNDDVTIQDATATNVAVALNHHPHTSFLLRDGQMSRSFKDLTAEFLNPAVLSLSQYVDRVLCVQGYQFLSNTAGRLGAMSNSNVKSYILEARKVANDNKMDDNGRRNLIWTSDSESIALDVELFTDASSSGGTTALERGVLGNKFGFRNFMCQNQPTIDNVATGTATGQKHVGAIDGAVVAGTTVLVVDGFAGYTVPAGVWVTIGTDLTPIQVASSTLTVADTTGITLVTGLVRDVPDNATITLINPGAVNGAKSAGYAGDITITAMTVAPQVGQGVSFGTSAIVYGIIAIPSSTTITLDRPLEASIGSTAAINLLPAGSYNFAFDQGSIALITRPLAMPDARTGALSYVASFGGLSLRVVMSYQGVKQGMLVTVDMLCGVKKLDDARGIVLLG